MIRAWLHNRADDSNQLETLAEKFASLRRGTLYLSLIGASFSLAYLFIDWLFFPAWVAQVATLRLVYAFYAFSIFLVLRFKPSAGGYGLSINFVTVTALTITALIMKSGGVQSPYCVAYNLLIFAIAVLLPWSSWMLGATALAMMLLYVIAVFGWSGTVLDAGVFANNLHFILISGIAAIIVLKLKYRLIEIAVRSRRDLSEQAARQMRFFRVLSHELRTPLTALSGAVELLDGSASPEEFRELTGEIKLNSSNLLSLMNGFLDFARLEAGQTRVEKRAFNAAQLLSEVSSAMQPLARARSLALTVAPSSIDAFSDPDLVRQVAINLVTNAIKFTPQGRVELRCELLEVAAAQRLLTSCWTMQGNLAVDGAPRWLCVTVSDSGIGIAPHQLPLLSCDFSQLNRRSAGYGGTGLGLAISRKIVELLGGALLVKSSLHQGSTFCLLLPADAAPAQTGVAPRDQSSPAEHAA